MSIQPIDRIMFDRVRAHKVTAKQRTKFVRKAAVARRNMGAPANEVL